MSPGTRGRQTVPDWFLRRHGWCASCREELQPSELTPRRNLLIHAGIAVLFVAYPAHDPEMRLCLLFALLAALFLAFCYRIYCWQLHRAHIFAAYMWYGAVLFFSSIINLFGVTALIFSLVAKIYMQYLQCP